MSHRAAAPDAILITVKLEASISDCPNAARHNTELAANANIASDVYTSVPKADVVFINAIYT